MAQELQNYIDGKWVDAQSGERFDVFNPATGEVVATAPGVCSRRSRQKGVATGPIRDSPGTLRMS